MRVRQILMVLAAAGLITGCTERAEFLAPGDAPAFNGGILTIGSGGKDESTGTPQTSGTNPDSTTSLNGILTIGSGG